MDNKRTEGSRNFVATVKEVGPDGTQPAVAIEPHDNSAASILITLKPDATIEDARALARDLNSLAVKITPL